MSGMFPQSQPRLLVSPVLSEEEEQEEQDWSTRAFSSLEETEDDLSTTLQTTETDKNNTVSSESSSSIFFTGFPQVAEIKVPSFESKMCKLSPVIPLAVTPGSVSIRSSLSSR